MTSKKSQSTIARYAMALLLTVITCAVIFAGIDILPIATSFAQHERVAAQDSANSTVEYWNDSLNAISATPAHTAPLQQEAVIHVAEKTNTDTAAKVKEIKETARQLLPKGKISVNVGNDFAGRKITVYPNLKQSFKETGMVTVDVTVDKSGNVTHAKVNNAASSIKKSSERKLALDMAKTLQFSRSKRAQQTGAVKFSFRQQ